MRKLQLTAVLSTISLLTAGANAAIVTGVTFSRAADTGTTFTKSDAFVTSLSTSTTTYDDVNASVTNTLAITNSSSTTRYFYAREGTNPGSLPAATGADATEGGVNVNGNVFFNAGYQDGDLIYLFDISNGTNPAGNDSFDLTLIDANGVAVSSAKSVTPSSFQASGRSVDFIFNPGAGGNASTQALVVAAFTQSEFTNVTGPVQGFRISGGDVDFATGGYASVAGVPEPTSIALLGLAAAGLLGRRRRRDA